MSIPYLHCGETKLLLQVKKDLERDEAFREFAYPDPLTPIAKKYKGKAWPWGFVPARQLLAKIANVNEADGAPWTYGFGFTEGASPDSRIERIKAERMLEEKILNMRALLAKLLPWFEEASFVTQTILINMAFNMGPKGLLKFRNTLRFIKEKNYKEAAANMRQSLWHKQVGDRARYLSLRMEQQEIPEHQKAPEKLC